MPAAALCVGEEEWPWFVSVRRLIVSRQPLRIMTGIVSVGIVPEARPAHACVVGVARELGRILARLPVRCMLHCLHVFMCELDAVVAMCEGAG